jgi:hypothetical protein
MTETEGNASSWEAVDIWQLIADIAAGIIQTPIPEILKRSDGQGLFYRGKINGIHGESGSGKTWALLVAVAQEIKTGNNVFYIDYEDTPQSLIMRLLALGVDGDTIGRHFHYIAPQTAYKAGEAVLMEAVRILQPTLIGIDSVGESTAAEGVNGNADDEVANWFKLIARPLARTGAAVALLDHVAKSSDGSLYSIGSQRKRAAIDGAQYLQETVKPFSKNDEGAARLICAKDRSGNYRVGQRVAMLRVIPDGERVQIELEVPDDNPATFKPTALMERVSHALEAANEPLSYRGILERVEGKKQYISDAVNALIREGYVSITPGARNSNMHSLLKPYVAANEIRGTLSGSNSSNSSVERARSLRGGTGHTNSTVPGEQSGHSGEQSLNVVHLSIAGEATA